jgi:hypothetical protein
MSPIQRSRGGGRVGAILVICAIMLGGLSAGGCVDGRVAEMQKQIDVLTAQVKQHKAALVAAKSRPDELIQMCFANRETLQAVKSTVADLDQRLRELDGKSTSGGVGPTAGLALGSIYGRGGRVDELEDRVREVEKTLTNLEFDIDYGR